MQIDSQELKAKLQSLRDELSATQLEGSLALTIAIGYVEEAELEAVANSGKEECIIDHTH